MSEYEYDDGQLLLSSLASRFEAVDSSRIDVDPDPVRWLKNDLGIDTYSMQRVILRLLELVPRVAVPSCHSAGKSYVAALATARFLSKYPPGTARVITTAPTGPQVRAVLWNEVNKLFDGAHTPGGDNLLPGRLTQTEWWIGKYLAALGRKPSDYAASTFQGLHAEHMLIIVDEAGGISADMWTAIETLLTSEDAHVLAIGNPDDPSAEFKEIVQQAENGENDWELVRIPAWKTPNFSGEIVAPVLKRVLLPRSWVESRRTAWGEDDPRWLAKVEAKFPEQSAMSVIRIGDVLRALERTQEDEDAAAFGFEDVQLGVDIAASETGDETVIRERRGGRILRRWSIRSDEPDDISDLIVQAQYESGATLIHVDATGVGFGFVSDVRRRIPGVAVLPFIAAAQARDYKQFVNRRAESYWTVREWLRKNAIDLTETQDSRETIAQLSSVQYKIVKGRIQIELKEDVRKRIGRSPDDADALCLAIEQPEGRAVPSRATVRASSVRRKQRDLEKLREQEGSTADDTVARTPRPVPQHEVAPHPRGMRARRRTRTLRALG